MKSKRDTRKVKLTQSSLPTNRDRFSLFISCHSSCVLQIYYMKRHLQLTSRADHSIKRIESTC